LIRRRESLSRAKSEICARPTKSGAFLVGNIDQSPPQDKSDAKMRKAFICSKKKRPGSRAAGAFFLKNEFPKLTDLRAEEPTVIFHFYLAAAK
jgi:hypothetical protein